MKEYSKQYSLAGNKSIMIPLLGISTDIFICKEYGELKYYYLLEAFYLKHT